MTKQTERSVQLFNRFSNQSDAATYLQSLETKLGLPFSTDAEGYNDAATGRGITLDVLLDRIEEMEQTLPAANAEPHTPEPPPPPKPAPPAAPPAPTAPVAKPVAAPAKSHLTIGNCQLTGINRAIAARNAELGASK